MPRDLLKVAALALPVTSRIIVNLESESVTSLMTAIPMFFLKQVTLYQ